MADEIILNTTPTQRNAHDAAIELLHIYLENQYSTDEPMDIDHLMSLYFRFYAIARVAERTSIEELKECIPNIKK